MEVKRNRSGRSIPFTQFGDRSISRNLTVSLALIVFVVVATTLALTYIKQAEDMRQEVESKADEYVARLAEILTLPIWTFDRMNISRIGSVFAQHELVNDIRIADFRGRTLFDFRKSEEEGAKIVRSESIDYQGQEIGRVEIALTLGIYRQELARLLAVTVGTLLGVLVVIVLSTGFLLGMFLRKPLTVLQQGIDRVAEGDFSISFERIRQRELAGIAKRFGEMASRVRDREQALQDANERLQEEIVERKQAEEALQESEARFREMADNIREVFWLFDWKEQRVLYVSPAYGEIWGRSAENLYKHYDDWADSIHPDDRNYAQESFVKILETGGGEDREYRIIRPDSEVRWISDRGFAITGEGGQVRRIAGIAEDITERKRVEAERSRLATILEATSDLVYTAMPDGEITYINKAGRRMIGCQDDQYLTGKRIPDIHPEWAFNIIQREGIPGAINYDTWTGETALIGVDGSEIPVSQVITSHKSPDGELQYLSTMVRDISDSKRAREEILREKRFSDTLINSLPGVFYLFDEKGNLLRWNQNLEEVTGYTTEEIARMKPTDFFIGDEKQLIAERIQEVLSKGISNAEANFVTKHQTKIPYYFTGLLLTMDVYRYVLGVGMDITERKRVEEELAKHRDRLEEMVKERTRELEAAQEELLARERLSVLGQLTATVSHELRNPLGVIRSSAFYLERSLKHGNETITKHLHRIEEQVGICDAIVDDLLEYTRGRHAEAVQGELNPWLEQVLDQIGEPSGVAIARELAPALPLLSIDREKMRRVVINLVENAIQAVADRQEESKKKDFSYQPQVKVSTAKGEDGVFIEVEDNGVGMNQETAERAFEPLFTKRARGTGLGLAIVKKIVEEHGGSVVLKSEPEQGTKVAIVVPIAGNTEH